jgi:hypothetical protein
MTPDVRIMFQIGERLGMSVTAVEKMSVREVRGWMEYFLEQQGSPAAPPNPDADALDPGAMDPASLRAAFHH